MAPPSVCSSHCNTFSAQHVQTVSLRLVEGSFNEASLHASLSNPSTFPTQPLLLPPELKLPLNYREVCCSEVPKMRCFSLKTFTSRIQTRNDWGTRCCRCRVEMGCTSEQQMVLKCWVFTDQPVNPLSLAAGSTTATQEINSPPLPWSQPVLRSKSSCFDPSSGRFGQDCWSWQKVSPLSAPQRRPGPHLVPNCWLRVNQNDPGSQWYAGNLRGKQATSLEAS